MFCPVLLPKSPMESPKSYRLPRTNAEHCLEMRKEGGYYNSKKMGDICQDICVPASRAALSMSRLHCILHGFDHKALLLLSVGLPLFIFGI
ncbi:hypothetical protein IEQ34_022630 [Dendrobium chrysotoxum]|uniref:Uncharacterized protein n=1 Tax=Dendrobium chrysotoxum TaxID=161865 RepID=A0AAV7FK68_DENCH|nr:hypothetical protein IEQ34_022630 [Dendrobium chrysotoxum]